MKTKERESKSNLRDYKELGENEKAIIERYIQGNKAEVPRLKVLENDPRQSEIDHPDLLVGQLALMDALGTTDLDFFNGLLSQLKHASLEGGKLSERELNFMLSVIKGIKPRDQVEAMLAAQMAAVHSAVMHFTSSLKHAETAEHLDCFERASNKLYRTFASQIEALKRHRMHDEQRVTVPNVTVNEGGQAIVGNVNEARRKNAPKMAPNSSSVRTRAQEDNCVSAPTDPNQVVPIRRLPVNGS